MSKLSKIVNNFKTLKNCPNYQKLIVKKCLQLSKLLKIVKKCKKNVKIVKKNCQNVGQVMFPHHSDQMFQRSQVSRVALCMSKVKVLWVTESVREWQGHLLSCSGQLKKWQMAIDYELNTDQQWKSGRHFVSA